MKKLFDCFLAAVFLAVAPIYSDAHAANIRVIVYGDSLTSGYRLEPDEAFPAKMERKLKEVGFTNVEVLNMSVPDETTIGGVDRLNTLLAKHPDIAIIELGSNDAMRGIKVELIYNNMITILSKLHEKSIYTILVGAKAPSNMGYGYGGQLDSAYRQLAATYGVSFYPYALEGIVGNAKYTFGDGIHPNAKGVEVMVENMYPQVDAAVRWKWDAVRTQQEYEQQYQRDMLQTETGGIAPQPTGAPAAQ